MTINTTPVIHKHALHRSRPPINLQVKNIESLIIPDDIMKLLRFDTLIQIQSRISNPFLPLHTLTHLHARRIDKTTLALRQGIQSLGR